MVVYGEDIGKKGQNDVNDVGRTTVRDYGMHMWINVWKSKFIAVWIRYYQIVNSKSIFHYINCSIKSFIHEAE